MMATQTAEAKPKLWQIDISHYAEKARWALDYKGVGHSRRSLLPGLHIPIALALTRGGSPTVPVLELDGEAIGDSTAIIAALEERFPEPPLYPADPELRVRALALEDYFDEQLGPYARVLPFHELIGEPDLFAEIAADNVPGPLGNVKPLVGAYARAYTSLRWGANSDAGAERARAGIVAAFERLESELETNGGDYLVGDSFTVADLTAASLFYPVVVPEGGPLPVDQQAPAALERFRDSLRDRPGYAWVEATYRNHRNAH
jgi:glutathione S-transferase